MDNLIEKADALLEENKQSVSPEELKGLIESLNTDKRLLANVFRIKDSLESLENSMAFDKVVDAIDSKDNIKVEVTNQKEIPDKVEVKNLEEIKPYKEVDINKPKWLEELKYDDALVAIIKTLRELKSKGMEVKIDNSDPRRPMAVRLSDGRKFYSAISQAVSQGVVPFLNPSGDRKSANVDSRGDLVVSKDPSINNPVVSLSYTSGSLTQIQKTINGITYTKTLSYTSGSLTGISAWS